MENTNNQTPMENDPLAALVNAHMSAKGQSVDTPVISSSTNTIPDDDIYGDNAINDEIAAEEKRIADERARLAAEQKLAKENEAAQTPFMPPDEHDMNYHKDAIGYQTDKLATVSLMLQKVVSKYRLISGGIPEETSKTDTGDIILGKFQLQGELIDIYHHSGEKITPEFENLILTNWIMPDGTRAINNINEDGIVIDKTMVNAPVGNSNNTTSSENNQNAPAEEATITINIPQGTRDVQVNVDDAIISQLTSSKVVNVNLREVTAEEMLYTNVVNNSDTPGVIKVHDSGINDVPVTLPLSGYRCTLRSINWIDFIRLTAPASDNASDNEIKKWSVIYEHIKNPSIGAFTDFEDFMKKTKYGDKELLMWALLVATSDDEETLQITCGNPMCKKPIRIKYMPRNIVHMDERLIPKWYIACHEAAVGEDAVSVWKKASQTRKRYKLPSTGIIVEINEPSAYEFVTEKLPLIEQLYQRFRPNDKMSNLDPQDVSMAEFDYLSANALYVSAMTITQNDPSTNQPKEYRYTNWEQIEAIITQSLDAHDSGVLLKIIQETRSKVSPATFSVDNVHCNSCGRHMDSIPVTDIGNTLLFQLSRRLSNIEINLIEMPQN